jgi:hypothetical protein
MKTKLSLVFVLCFTAATLIQAQSKSDLQESLTSCTTEKDSIQNALIDLSAMHDSLNTSYTIMYDAISEKVFKGDFNPAQMPELIDSLQANNSFMSAALNDSISSLSQKNTELNKMLDKNGEFNVQTLNSLKQLKELLDSGIINQEDFDKKKEVLLEEL